MLRILFFAFLTTFSLQSIAQVTAVPDANGIVYVDFTKNGDGNSWNNAIKELADALRTAKTNTNIKQVWVAKGTYKPKYKPTTNNSTTDRDITFVVPNGVSLYGGFDPINDISTLADRRITGDDGTILDGQTSASNQVYHVVLFSLNTAQVIIDGFTVINGNANGPQNSSITTEGRKVYRDYGSAIYKENSSLIVRNCIIKNNKTTGFGGPLGMYGTGTARIENCTVQNNIGGMSIIDFGTTGTVINTLMSNNTTGGQSNAINAWDSSVTVVNSTIANNRGGAGPIYVEGAGVDVKIYNSIIYGNNPQRVAIATGAGIRRIYAYNSLMDVNTGLTAPTTGSIFGQNPLFVSPIAVGLGFGGDYSLQRNSIAINKGLQTDYTTNGGNLNDKDLSGLRNRVIGAIDMGAYEYGQHINSIADITKTYGDADFIVNATATSGLQVALTSSNPDIATVYQDANDNNAWKIHIVKAGTATIKANQAGNATFPPALEVTFKVTINKKPLTLAFITPFSKEYDRLTTANVTSNLKLNGVVGTDNVGHSFTTANYNNKNVGTAKAITLGNVSLTGSAASNYTLTAPALTGNITAKPLTIATSNNVVISKVYNGNNDASFTQSQFVFSGRITGDAVSFSGSATYADKSVGVGKVVTINGITLTGADALNYSLTSTSVTTSGAITRKPLTLAVSNTPLITKVYDAGTTASVPLNQFTLTGVVGGEDVSFISTSTTYNNKNAGTAKTITVAGIALDGTEAGNYSLAITSLNTTGDITAKPLTLTVSNTPTITKVYDGNDNATIPLAQYTLSGVLGNENVGFSTTDVNYDNKNVGIGKNITASGIVLNGTDAANYSLAITSLTTTGDITVKPLTLTVSNTPAITKVYDGNDNASIPLNQFTLTGKVGSEVVNFDYTDISFDDKNTGTAKDVTVNGITLNGADKDNYSLAITSLTTTGSITAKPLTLAVSSTPLITKVYDAGTTASVPLNQFTLTGVVGGEDVSFISTSTTYNNKNAGTAKTITVAGIALDGTEAGNYSLAITSLNTTGDITAKPLTLTVSNTPTITKVYDGNDNATIPLAQYTLSGVLGNENVGFSTTDVNYDNKNVGIGKNITASGIVLNGTDAANYSLAITSLTTTGDITVKPLTLTVSNTPAITKVYDGNDSAVIPANQFTLTGKVGSEVVNFDYTDISFDDKNTGTAKDVTVNGITLNGADKDNYSLAITSLTTTGSITAKPLTLAVSSTPLITKVYDAGTTASVPLNQFTLTGVVGGEDVSFISTSTTYNNKNAGTAKTITVAGIALDGTEAGNYSLAITSLNTTGDITAKPLTLTVSNTPTITKVYDGNDNATIPLAQYTLSGVLGNENVGFSTTDVNYDNKNVGIGKSITASGIVLNGTDAANYSLAITSLTTTGDITVKPLTLTVSITPAITKVYDGNDNASIPLNQFTLTGKVGSEVVNFDYTDISFDDKNTGTAKDVTVNGITLNGADKDNYSLAITSLTTTGSITAKPLTLAVSSTPLITKVYDGNNTATIPLNQFALTGIVGTEDVSFNSTNTTYNDKNAGTAKTITVAGIALDGTEAGNYSLAITSLNTTGDITAKPLTLTVSNTPTITKVYDGNDNATIPLAQYTLSGVLGNENVGFSTTDVNYDNKNVGIGKSITASGIALNGTDAANYSLAITSLTTTGDITVKPLTLTVSNTPAITKVYDGNDSASIPLNQFTLTGKVGSEVVNFDYTDISFDDKNTGTAKDVTVNGITLNGADKDNYSLAITSLTTTGSITAKPLTLAVSSTPLITKVYDAGTTASVPLNQFTLTGVVGGEDVSFISTSTTYNNKNAGTAKTITVAGIALDGTEAGNYSLAITSLNTTGDITAKPLTLTVSNTPTITKVYDGNDNATIPLAQYTLSGVLGNENVGFSTTDVNYDNKNVGIGKSITASGIVLNGTDASNYSLAITSLTTTGDITVKPLTLRLVNTAEVVTKVYDNTTNAPITNGQMMLEGVASNDYVSFAFGSINYDNKNVGDNRTITIEGVTLGGVNAGNYMIDANKTLLGNITPKPLDIIRSTSNSTVPGKVYDGNSSATVATEMLSLVGVNGTDKVEHTKSSANYNDENAGVDKDVTVSGISLTGDDAYNYSLSKTSIIIKGEITPKPLTLIVRHTPAITKVYDGSTTASIPLEQFTLSGALTTEIVGFTYGSISYENKQVGTGKMVTVNDLSLTGPYALNYSLPSNSLNTTGDITAKPLSLIVSNTPAITKVYDGSSVAHIPLGQFMLSGGLPSENVVFTHGAIAYDDKNVGNTKNITISNIALSGADAANYILALKSLNTSGSITAKPLNVSVSSTPLITKLYDGTTTATIPTSNFNIDGVINSEDVNIAHSAINYNNKNVGNNKNVAISGIVLTGNDASNYSLVSNALTTTGNISPKPITISINANPLISKTYDGNDLANLLPANYVIDGIIGADQLSVRGTAKYSNNVKGNGKTILVNDFILDGADQLNYSISTTSTNTVGNIIGITPVIAWNNPSDIGYGKYLDVNELNASTNVSGSFAYSPNLGTLLNAGSNQTLSVTFTPSDLDGYEIVTKTILVNVLKRDLTIAVNNAERCYQTNNPSFRFDYFGFANNENESVLTNRPSISSDANHNSTAGIYRLVASGGVSNNYNFIYQNGTLTINALPVVNISASAVLINQGESATLNASGGTNYVWRDNNGTLVGSGESLVVSPTETTQYVVEVTNSSGCVSSKNISISVIKPLVIPNAFSPNGDGVHDWWEIKHIDQYPTALIQIFDISGARVYESRGYANPFDGNFKNQPLKTGVYYYVININNGNKPYTGPLTIIR